MIAIILAGGFAQRLLPLTAYTPKPLLEVSGRPMINYVYDKVKELGTKCDETIILTNHVFFSEFCDWADNKHVTVIDDGSTNENSKVGAVGALAQVAMYREDADVLILAGDTLFHDSLMNISIYFEIKNVGVIGLFHHKYGNQGSEVHLDGKNKITWFIEKPNHPFNELESAVMYFLPSKSFQRVSEYMQTDGSKDSPGRFIEWLCQKEAVYGYVLEHPVLDIGTPAGFEQAYDYVNRIQVK